MKKCTCYTPPKYGDPGEVAVCPACEEALAVMREAEAKIMRGMRSMTDEEQAAANDLFGNFTNPQSSQGSV